MRPSLAARRAPQLAIGTSVETDVFLNEQQRLIRQGEHPMLQASYR